MTGPGVRSWFEDGPLSGLTGGDWARYAGLLAMASLLFLVVWGDRDGGLLALLALYLLGAGVLALVLRRAGQRS